MYVPNIKALRITIGYIETTKTGTSYSIVANHVLNVRSSPSFGHGIVGRYRGLRRWSYSCKDYSVWRNKFWSPANSFVKRITLETTYDKMAKLSTHLRAITIFTQRKPSCGNPLPYLYWQNKLLNYKWYLTFWENQLLSTWQIQVYSLWRLRDYYLTSDGRHVSDRWALTDLNCRDPD